MNQSQRNAAIQSNARPQEPLRRPAPAPAGNTTYEGGDFRARHTARESYSDRARDARPVNNPRDARSEHAGRSARHERTDRATQATGGRDFRIPRGEATSSASAETREILEVREAHSHRSPCSSHGGSNSHSPRDGRNNGGSKGGKRNIIIALIIIVLLCAGLGVWKFANLTPEEATGGAFYDQSASEIQEAVDHEVEDGYFNMSINTSVPVFEDNSAALGIKNIESNSYDCIVTVTLEDGTEVYKSGGLAPGTELDMVTLTQQLDPGDYEATAVFEIYEQDEEHTVAGQTASKLTLHVL